MPTFRKSYQRLSGMLALALDTLDSKQAVFEGSSSAKEWGVQND